MYQKWKRTTKNIGLLQTVFLILQEIRLRLFKSKSPYRLWAKNAKYPLWCRAGASDYGVFHHVFLHDEYASIHDISPVEFIIDCGANVGYSSAYFLSRFPHCKLVAVEPAKNNFSALKKNLRPYGNRVRLVHSAIWSHPAYLKIAEDFGIGGEWGYQVKECEKDDPSSFLATDIETLLKESGQARVSILKMDIEGAEAIVFSAHTERWLDLVDNIAIELHDDTPFGSASDVFHKACDGKFHFLECGELTIGRRIVSH